MSYALAKTAAEQALLKQKGVVGVGGTEEKIRVYVEGSPGFDVIPRSIAGYDVEIVKVGHVKALTLVQEEELAAPMEAARAARVRPVPGGVSIGHPLVTAGTNATALPLGGTLYGLSNNHVLAAVSTLQAARARIGDVVLQPGRVDGGVAPGDVIGTLYRYVPLNEFGVNLVDCALFKPTSPDLLSMDIMGLAPFSGFKRAEVGMAISKSGRTSGVTAGKVADVDATMSVDYGTFQATFRHQIVSDFMASPGDSGSLTMDPSDYAAVGLVYAGSEYITMHNHIGDVLGSLVGVRAVLGPRLLGLLSIPFGVALAALI